MTSHPIPPISMGTPANFFSQHPSGGSLPPIDSLSIHDRTPYTESTGLSRDITTLLTSRVPESAQLSTHVIRKMRNKRDDLIRDIIYSALQKTKDYLRSFKLCITSLDALSQQEHSSFDKLHNRWLMLCTPPSSDVKTDECNFEKWLSAFSAVLCMTPHHQVQQDISKTILQLWESLKEALHQMAELHNTWSTVDNSISSLQTAFNDHEADGSVYEILEKRIDQVIWLYDSYCTILTLCENSLKSKCQALKTRVSQVAQERLDILKNIENQFAPPTKEEDHDCTIDATSCESEAPPKPLASKRNIQIDSLSFYHGTKERYDRYKSLAVHIQNLYMTPDQKIFTSQEALDSLRGLYILMSQSVTIEDRYHDYCKSHQNTFLEDQCLELLLQNIDILFEPEALSQPATYLKSMVSIWPNPNIIQDIHTHLKQRYNVSIESEIIQYKNNLNKYLQSSSFQLQLSDMMHSLDSIGEQLNIFKTKAQSKRIKRLPSPSEARNILSQTDKFGDRLADFRNMLRDRPPPHIPGLGQQIINQQVTLLARVNALT